MEKPVTTSAEDIRDEKVIFFSVLTIVLTWDIVFIAIHVVCLKLSLQFAYSVALRFLVLL